LVSYFTEKKMKREKKKRSFISARLSTPTAVPHRYIKVVGGRKRKKKKGRKKKKCDQGSLAERSAEGPFGDCSAHEQAREEGGRKRRTSKRRLYTCPGALKKGRGKTSRSSCGPPSKSDTLEHR